MGYIVVFLIQIFGRLPLAARNNAPYDLSVHLILI